MSSIDPRPTREAPDDDPYLWLEEIDGARALRWVAAQTEATIARFTDARVAADQATLKALFDRPDNLVIPERRAGRLLDVHRDAAHPRGVWRTTTLASFLSDEPFWETLLDLDAFAEAEGEDWVWGGVAASLPPDHDRALLHLSRGGADATPIREFDLATRRFVADGFNLPEAKTGVAWLDRDTLLFCSSLGEGMATASGFPRTARLWRRGTDPLAAPALFEAGPTSIGVQAHVDRSVPVERVVFTEALTLITSNRWIGDRDSPRTRLDLPPDCSAQIDGDWLAAKPRTAWQVGGETHAPDTLIVLRLSAFIAGDRRFTRLFVPGERQAIRGFAWSGGRLLLSILDNLRPTFEILTPSPGGWARETIGGLPDLGSVSVWPFDADDPAATDLLASASDPLTPPSLYLIETGAALRLVKREPMVFDANGLVGGRHEAVSSDGTRIPYVQVGPSGESGDAPVHLIGYGGFGVSMTAAYYAPFGKLWLERGGTVVIANIRGGGEFGIPWTEAGRRAGRRLSQDDFAAIAADLVRRGVTRPGRIAAEGASNGGLLVANMLTRYPERFGAIACSIPILDMRRYTKLHSGQAYIEEYGDPEKPEDWAFLADLSPYHAAEPGRRYPPILLSTSQRDDRVHPGHARKMAAKLQAMGYEAHFHEQASGGHGFGKDNEAAAAFRALVYGFLRRAIGWEE